MATLYLSARDDANYTKVRYGSLLVLVWPDGDYRVVRMELFCNDAAMAHYVWRNESLVS